MINIKQAGRIIIEGELAVKFWIRALDLQSNVDFARSLMLERSERKWGSVPIVAEYKVDERLTFVYLIVAMVDALGVKDGTGMIYFASPDRLVEVKKVRDEYANDLLKNMERGFDEVVEMPDKSEGTRLD
jgi:CRISPR/Cas system-associated exonuclease Cas4 (RecB family)